MPPLEVRKVYVQGDTAVAEMVARGTHKGPLMGIPPTNKTVEITICNVAEVRDGKLYREREYMDMLHMLSQLGVCDDAREGRRSVAASRCSRPDR